MLGISYSVDTSILLLTLGEGVIICWTNSGTISYIFHYCTFSIIEFVLAGWIGLTTGIYTGSGFFTTDGGVTV